MKYDEDTILSLRLLIDHYHRGVETSEHLLFRFRNGFVTYGWGGQPIFTESYVDTRTTILILFGLQYKLQFKYRHQSFYQCPIRN